MIGIVHPGEMGAAIGRLLTDRGHQVAWAGEGRSADTHRRAAGLTDLGTVARLAEACEVLLSVCPPHAAVQTADRFRDYRGLFADLNAISPMLTRTVAGSVHRFVDGGIVGPPPHTAGTTRLYLCGTEIEAVAALFEGTPLDTRPLGDRIGDASALKMAYAAWTKGSTAMLLAIRAAARELGVEDALVREWEQSQPELPARSVDAARLGLERGWRWSFELAEIGRTFAAAGLPGGFGAAAAEIYAHLPRDAEPTLDAALRALHDR